MHAQKSITSDQVYKYCQTGVEANRPVDALYINGAGWDAAPVISRLEQDLGISVVWGPVAEMWLSYWRLGISSPQPDCGLLLKERYGPVIPV
jgi:maleate cis-trans isomerase